MTCEVCGGPTTYRRCSPECYRIARWGGSRKVAKPCGVCGTEFTSYASDGKVVCSRTCDSARKSAIQSGEQSVFWRGGRVAPYVGTWRRQRRLALDRDGHRCVLCGSSDRPQVHHKRPARYGGTHDLDNLITLCRSCHSREELLVNEAYQGTAANLAVRHGMKPRGVCWKGHDLTQHGVYRHRGPRAGTLAYCRPCRNDRARERYAARHADPSASQRGEPSLILSSAHEA